jgi:hypothetical protein
MGAFRKNGPAFPSRQGTDTRWLQQPHYSSFKRSWSDPYLPFPMHDP